MEISLDSNIDRTLLDAEKQIFVKYSYLGWARCSREDLVPSSKKCAFPSLSSRGKVEDMEGGEVVGTRIGMQNRKDSLFSSFKK